MMSENKFKCPVCNSRYFLTRPNRYDILEFLDGKYKIVTSEFTNDEDRIFCRECGSEIDERASMENKRVILQY